MLWTVLVIVALLIIVALSYYAGRLLFQLKQQNQRQKKIRDERIESISESIITIAKAMEQQQCDLSEGVIRIVNLLGALPILSPPDHKASYPHTYALFLEVSGFAVLEDRQKLSKQERRKQDIAREQIESDYESKVLSEIPAIKSYCQSIS
ncbi:DUF2489 domain-containing protein [Alteromonas sp. 1_MG-2023]|uniref:DUF2489 domain-containing protein n=1 Tax=Alteromonas sp. 1_MG-2023 TaxID=3062669 RepID=UPI0026E158B8|nr:DUF2489 domain-containing protein [Alteromonas sp. 1_MG-2023]MDO6566740.1 DUF2489 domain-containing protein [Alteromonas sp. 1_MG-2023]